MPPSDRLPAAAVPVSSLPRSGGTIDRPGWRRRLAGWFFRPPEGSLAVLPWPVRAVNFAAAVLMVAGVLWIALTGVGYHWIWGLVFKYRGLLLGGWWMTLRMAGVALLGSLAVGLFFALSSRARFLPLRYLSRIYVELVLGTPLLVQISIGYYGLANSLRIDNRYLVGGLVLAFFGGASVCEIIRGGIESIGKSQRESAKAIGLTTPQTYLYVILPQAVRQILPPLAAQFAGFIKDSSLLSTIAVADLFFNAKIVAGNVYATLEPDLLMAFGYLVLTIPLSVCSRWLERRNRFDT